MILYLLYFETSCQIKKLLQEKRIGNQLCIKFPNLGIGVPCRDRIPAI